MLQVLAEKQNYGDIDYIAEMCWKMSYIYILLSSHRQVLDYRMLLESLVLSHLSFCVGSDYQRMHSIVRFGCVVICKSI